jgi:predicted nucleic acid-binding protein
MNLSPQSYLIDSCVFIDQMRGIPQASDVLKQAKALTSDYHICYSTLTIGELWSGLRGNRREEELEAVLAPFTELALSNGVAKEAGKLRASLLGQQGQRIPPLGDALIAATARLHNLVVITNNRRDYAPLKVELISYNIGN